MKNVRLSTIHFCFAIALAFIAPTIVHATSFYVDNTIATSGNGTSWSSAWKNFSNINWGSIHAGDVLYISGGASSQTYYETLTIGASGASGNPIIITKGIDAGHNGTVILDEQNTRYNGVYSSGYSYFTIQNLSAQNVADACFSVRYVTAGVLIQNNKAFSGMGTGNGADARGYDIRNSSGVTVLHNSYDTPSSTTSQTDGIWSSGNDGVTFDGNIIDDPNGDDYGHSDGIQSYQDINVTFRNNYISHINGGINNHGIYITDTKTGGTVDVYNNVIYMPKNDTYAVSHWNQNYPTYNGRARFYNNTIYGGNPGINFRDSPNSEAKNNIVFVSGSGNWGAMYLYGNVPSGSTIDNNLLWAINGASVVRINDVVKTWSQWQALGYDTHGVNADPKLTNAAGLDFTLQSSSPAIDKGATLSQITSDKNGILRPQGTAYDIGAYEFASSITCTIPSGIGFSTITTTGATINWTSTGATSYNVQYKLSTASTWTTVSASTNNISLTGLNSGTTYNVQVQSVCGSTTSAYSAVSSFTTVSATVISLTASPSSVAAGGSVTASWSNVANPTTTDWIGVYLTGAADNAYTSWSYTSSCSQTAGSTAAASGSCNFTMPTTAGTYEFRLFANNGYTKLATSSTVTVVAKTCGTDVFESNETRSTAHAVSVNATSNGLICPATDLDWFKFSNSSTARNIKITLTNLPADYDLYLYNSKGTLLKSSSIRGVTDESVVYNTSSVGTYYVRVIGYNGATDNSLQYNLNVNISSTTQAIQVVEPMLLNQNNNSTLTGVNELSDVPTIAASVYPNPFNTNFTLKISDEIILKNALIKMVDVSGREVKTVLINSNETIIERGELQSGIYFYSIINGDKSISKGKLIVQ